MTKHTVISARIDAELLAKLDRIAAFNERSRAWVISRLLDSAATKELEFVDFIQVGLDDIAAGRSAESRGGQECVSTCRSRWSRSHYKQHKSTAGEQQYNKGVRQ